jgi:hypothetical protein
MIKGKKKRNYKNQKIKVYFHCYSTTYNQINSRVETPTTNSYFSPSRRFQNQKQFIPTMTQQQPIAADQQQYSQSLTQQPLCKTKTLEFNKKSFFSF